MALAFPNANALSHCVHDDGTGKVGWAKVAPGVRQGLLCTHVGSGVYGVKGTRSLEKFTIRFERREKSGREDKWEDT